MKIKTYDFDGGIKLVGLCDAHIGNKFFDLEAFTETVEYIRRNKRVFWFIDGDIIENIVQGTFNPYDQSIPPDEQIELAIELLEPIKHRGLFAISGNHVARTKKVAYLDLMKSICARLNIDYLGTGGLVRFNVGSQEYIVAVQHGRSGAITKGASFTELAKMMKVYSSADVYLLGHDHNLEFTILPTMIINQSNEEEMSPKYVGRTGNYLKYAEYARERLYEPKVQGSLSIHFFSERKKINCNKLVYLNSKPLWK